jgi:hypothetical protein
MFVKEIFGGLNPDKSRVLLLWQQKYTNEMLVEKNIVVYSTWTSFTTNSWSRTCCL